MDKREIQGCVISIIIWVLLMIVTMGYFMKPCIIKTIGGCLVVIIAVVITVLVSLGITSMALGSRDNNKK